MEQARPKLFVITGPSGVGKGTILAEFLKTNRNIKYSVSATTRPPRRGEIDGVNYFFITKEEFEKIRDEDGFLEWAIYNGNCYGTRKDYVANLWCRGYDVVLEVEVQGARQVMRKDPDCVTVFIAPPSLDELERRLRGRKSEDETSIQKRLNIALNELGEIKSFKYNLVNDTIENVVEKLQEIYEREKAVGSEK